MEDKKDVKKGLKSGSLNYRQGVELNLSLIHPNLMNKC